MAYRGRGRGRGGGGSYNFYCKQEPFELFPKVDLPKRENVTAERNLILWNSRLLNYWKSSPYYLEETEEKKNQSADIERYSDCSKPKTAASRDSILQFLQLSNFPQELIKDTKEQRSTKKVRWNPKAGLGKLDLFEKLEEKFQGQEENDKEKKEGEDEEEEDDEAIEEADEEFSDDGDYNQNVDFDDDEDDYNMDDDGGDEPTY